jgi:glyoxylase-like metal-dependent hydrolase (beta-lactamase superfamily II)
MQNRTWLTACASLSLLALSLASVQQACAAEKAPRARKDDAAPAADPQIRILPVQGKVYMLAGGGGNVAVQVGEEGVVVVDTGLAARSGEILAAIRTLSDKPVRYVVNTHVHDDHIGGNEAISRAGISFGGGNTRDQAFSLIYAHENVLNAMSAPTGQKAAVPSGLWPTDTYFEGSMEIYFNDEPIELLYQPAAHTDGDSVVFFRRSDVIATGDVYITTGYPVIDLARGGTINGIIDALNRIIDITIPKENQEDGTLVIPGHGRLSDEYDVVVYRDMVTIIRDRVQDLIGKGMTLEQVQAARPSFDYDGRFGATSGRWTTEKFIEAVYRTLQPQAAQ